MQCFHLLVNHHGQGNVIASQDLQKTIEHSFLFLVAPTPDGRARAILPRQDLRNASKLGIVTHHRPPFTFSCVDAEFLIERIEAIGELARCLTAAQQENALGIEREINQIQRLAL